MHLESIMIIIIISVITIVIIIVINIMNKCLHIATRPSPLSGSAMPLQYWTC